jgi:hypothetical protein
MSEGSYEFLETRGVVHVLVRASLHGCLLWCWIIGARRAKLLRHVSFGFSATILPTVDILLAYWRILYNSF